MTLNRYSLLALDFCRSHRPNHWAATTDPISTFEAIGEDIQAQVTRTRDEMLGPPRPGEHPMDLDQRASQALATAEELILSEQPSFQPEATTNPDELTEDDPVLAAAWTALAAVNQAIQQPLD